MIITIFTPIYNRAYLLQNLYNSLLAQTHTNFEWVIVDDGSTDDVESLVKRFKDDNKINIIFHRQNNSGKHIAINNGVELANGELFIIVDSDDYLLPTAVQFINEHYSKIKDDEQIAGLSGRRGYSDLKAIGSQNFNNPILLNYLDFRFRKGVVGDMAEVMKIGVMRKYPFPVSNEKFCPEALVWSRIALKYKVYWSPAIIYIGEYLEGGLSDKIVEIRQKSPINSTTYYSELEKMPIPFIQKIKANINYWRFARFLNSSFKEKLNKVNPIISIVGLPLSLVFIVKDK